MPDDLGAAVEQRSQQMRPDETCGTGDERLHAKTCLIRSGSRHGLPAGSSAA